MKDSPIKPRAKDGQIGLSKNHNINMDKKCINHFLKIQRISVKKSHRKRFFMEKYRNKKNVQNGVF